MLWWGAENDILATYLHLSKYTFFYKIVHGCECDCVCICCFVLCFALHCIALYCFVFAVCLCFLFVFFVIFFTKRLRIFDWCKLWYDSYGFWLRQQWFGSDACLLSSVSCSNLEPMGWRLFHDRFTNRWRTMICLLFCDDKSRQKKTKK